LDNPSIGEGTFVFDVFGEDDTNYSHGSRPMERPAQVASLVLQIGHKTSAIAPHEITHDCNDKSQTAAGRQENKVIGPGDLGQDQVSLDDGWQADQILRESKSGSTIEVVVTKTVWLPKAALGLDLPINQKIDVSRTRRRSRAHRSHPS
jgi:hypothetical protein